MSGKRYQRIAKTRDIFRRRLIAKGYSQHTVTLIKEDYNNESSLFGTQGTKHGEHRVLMDPGPLLFNVNLQDIESGNGRIKEGDIRIMQISPIYLDYVQDPQYQFLVEGPEFNGLYSRIDGENMELTPYSLAIKARRTHPK